jgi:hypothetical protein
MKHFNPFAGRAETAQPVITDSTKPKRARAKAKAAAPAEPTPAVAKPVALDNARGNALMQAAERVPLATYGALLIATDCDAISAKTAFLNFCFQRGADFRDWRIAWKAFEKADFPGAHAIADPVPAGTPSKPSNIIPFTQPVAPASSLDDVLASLR